MDKLQKERLNSIMEMLDRIKSDLTEMVENGDISRHYLVGYMEGTINIVNKELESIIKD